MPDRAWQALIALIIVVGVVVSLNILADGGAFR